MDASALPATDPCTGLVLAGGGARGAYEVGVLYYLFVAGPRWLREAARFQVITGTSVGALNAASLAATAHDPEAGMRKLADIWTNLTVDSLLPMEAHELFSVPGWLLGRSERRSLLPGDEVENVIEASVDWDQMQLNLANGHLEAMSISATRVATGRTVVFYQTRDGQPRPWSRDPHVAARWTRLGPMHARASAAIPLLFPSIDIGDERFVDGGIRQNTPISPAVRLGANRLLIVGLSHKEKPAEAQALVPLRNASADQPIYLLGKVLNAVMLDHLDYDLIRMRQLNQILKDGVEAFGPGFLDQLNQVVEPVRGHPYKVVEPLVVLQPSRDLGRMAAQYIRTRQMRARRGMVARMLRILSRAETSDEADLTSYILFEGGYARDLITLGMEDAEANLDALERLFEV